MMCYTYTYSLGFGARDIVMLVVPKWEECSDSTGPDEVHIL
jgi:hypothetical protein